MVLPHSFYQRPTQDLAQLLLGQILVHQTDQGRIAGKIVETEAYVAHDPANHAFRGKTTRTAVMFGPAGFAYIYRIYGMYFCLNVVSGKEGSGEAVLIRALEPLEGIPIMQHNRQVDSLLHLSNGPAKLMTALAIPAAYNGHDFTQAPLVIEAGETISNIIKTTRVGISKAVNEPLRFYIKDNPFISKK